MPKPTLKCRSCAKHIEKIYFRPNKRVCDNCMANKIKPAKTNTQRVQAYRRRMCIRPDNPEVTAHSPITAEERKYVRYLDNLFIHHSIAVAQEMPILFTSEEVEQMYEYSRKKNSSRVEPITFDAAINPERRRDQRKLWTNYTPDEIDTEGRLLRYTRYDLTEALRRQRTPPECLIRVIRMLLLWHGPDTLIVIKELKSKPGCGKQFDHFDDPMQYTFRQLKHSERQFSGLIAIEPNTNPTTLDYPMDDITGEERGVLRVAQGRMVMWEAGKWIHAGSNYDLKNRRIFFSASSPRFPTSESVGLVGADVEIERQRKLTNAVDIISGSNFNSEGNKRKRQRK